MRIVFFFYLLITSVSCTNKDSFHFMVEKEDGIFQSGPFCLELQKIEGSVNLENPIVLYQEFDEDAIEIPFQIDKAGNTMCFVRSSFEHPNENSYYRIENGAPTTTAKVFLSEHKENGNLQLEYGGNPVILYRYEMTYPPNGVDSLFRKSGYIHPVITPKGDTLTRIQPPDHYHHYGMWGPWTHTQIEGQQIDFWNLGDHKGTVLFKKFNDSASGNVFASFNAAQEHIDLVTQARPQVALNENLEVTLWNLMRPDRYMFDYKTTFKSPLKNGILLEAYHYGGGIGMRFTERWKADNCFVLTSEGHDRSTADGTNARWAIVWGGASDGKNTNGILFMSHPENRMHPEPMRVWPIDANGGRGDMFFEFCPIRHKEWKIAPNKRYGLRYRMVVFEGELSATEAEAYWQAFANPQQTKIILN